MQLYLIIGLIFFFLQGAHRLTLNHKQILFIDIITVVLFICKAPLSLYFLCLQNEYILGQSQYAVPIL